MQESGEMYLETILVLSEKKDNVRSIDVVEYMNYSKPSISRAVARLKEGGYITVSREGYLKLTETGKEIAERIYERHVVLTRILEKLGVNEKTAADDACRIEHVISAEAFEALKTYVSKLDKDIIKV